MSVLDNLTYPLKEYSTDNTFCLSNGGPREGLNDRDEPGDGRRERGLSLLFSRYCVHSVNPPPPLLIYQH